jgi:hypothetical protein
MSKRKRRAQAHNRVTFARTWPNGVPRHLCMACGEPGPHFVPPSFGDEGFFMCTQMLHHGKAVEATVYGNENFAPPRGVTLGSIPAELEETLVLVQGELRGLAE